MPAIAFDTLHYVKRLQKAGVSAQQAEAQADVLSEVMSLNLDKLATKEDVKDVRTDIERSRMATEASIEALRVATESNIEALRITTQADIKEVKADIEQSRATTESSIEALRITTQADIAGVKTDIEGLRVATKADIEGLRVATKADIEGVRSDTKNLAGQIRMIVWMMGIMAAGMFGLTWAMFSMVAKIH